MFKVAIVGIGPAGIAMGGELVQAGIPSEQVLLLEKSDKDSASIRQFYPVGKDINSVYKNIDVPIVGIMGFTGLIQLDDYYTMTQKIIEDNHLDIVYNKEVQKIIKKDNHFEIYTSNGEYEAEYVVLCSGVFAKPRKPDYSIAGTLLKNISYDIVKIQKENISDLDILVVGGGDSASEYVQILANMNNRVTLSYRQDNIFRMNQLNVERLEKLVTENKVAKALGTNITSIEPDGDRIKILFKEREEMIVDKIVYSLGGASPTAFMANCGLDYDDTNVVLRDNNETTIDGLFMIGDLAAGRKGGSIMLGCKGAREVMELLHNKYQLPAPKKI